MPLLSHGVEHGSEGATNPEPAHVSDMNAPLARDDEPRRERIAVPMGEKAFGILFPSHLVDSWFHGGDEVLEDGGGGVLALGERNALLFLYDGELRTSKEW